MMAMTTPRAAALKIAAVYWALLLFGMAIYTTMRMDALSALAPVWAGTIGGTVLGQILAVRRYRPWLAVLIVLAVALFVLPHAPAEVGGKRLWAAFLPSAMCGYWSLGDRTSLVAFWFPAVIWMLSILDGTGATSTPSRNGIVLLAALAALFVIYLRVREERRIALWRTVAPEPLAKTRAPILVKEPAGVQVARGAWGVLVTGLGFAAAAWLAPSLWRHESHEGQKVSVETSHEQLGLPCCPAVEEDEPVHTRVKEYFDIGRGDTQHKLHRPGTDCRVCTGEATVASTEPYTGGGGGTVVVDGSPTGGAWTPGPQDIVDPQPQGRVRAGWSAPAGDYGYPTGDLQRGPYTPPAAMPTGAMPAPSQPSYVPGAIDPSPAGPVGMSETNTPVANPPPPAPVLPQVVEPTPQAAPPPPPPQQAPIPQQQTPWHSANQPHSQDTPTPTGHTGVAYRSDSDTGPPLLHWIAVMVLAMFMMKAISLALRPLRRMVVLRHLHHPFWTETVDQRVSNAWQLVLVGLRDAGWRPDSAESPRELAKRVEIDGVEKCATILDRTRHGIRIDREDLDVMVESASSAYRGSRKRLGIGARLVSWLRWPLV